MKRYTVTYDYKMGGAVIPHTWSVIAKSKKDARKEFDKWHESKQARSVLTNPPHAFHIEVKLCDQKED